MNMAGYLNIENIKKNLVVFENALLQRDSLSLKDLAIQTSTNPSRLLFDTMKQIANDPPAVGSLKQLNEYTLQKFYAFYTKKLSHPKNDIDLFENENLVSQVLNELNTIRPPSSSVAAPENETGSFHPPGVEMPQYLLPQPTMKDQTHYITINGYDRNWVSNPLRYKFAVDVTSFFHSYRNITEIELTKLILTPKKNELVTPYLIVKIGEFMDVKTDGLNEANKTSFATFLFDKKVDNCIIMRSIHDRENQVFDKPLSSLPKMSIEITRPNNYLFNYEMDNHRLWRLEYDDTPEHLIRVIITQFTDKDDFQLGHIVYFKNVLYPFYSSETDSAYHEYIDNQLTYDRIMSFINRKEGHEVKKQSSITPDNQTRGFLIQAPGRINTKTGKFEVDTELVNLIKETETQSFDYQNSPTPTGALINGSIQPIVSFKIKQLVPITPPSLQMTTM